MLGLALRTYGRYAVPLTLISIVVFAPACYSALRAPPPNNAATAISALRFAWTLAATGWAYQLVLVGAAAPLVRGVAAGAPLSQPRAVAAALANLIKMALPCLTAIAAIVLGALALVVPAIVVFGLLALTGASRERGIPAPLADSARSAQTHAAAVACVLAAMLAVDLVLALAAWKLGTVPIAGKLAPAQWAAYGQVARVVAIGLAIVSPVFAMLLAAIHVAGSRDCARR
jgi:hypothetical protein